jgi:D-3-phosphoglycerate dehydrogenase
VRVAVTCIQLLRDLDQHLPQFESHGLTPHPADVPGQHLEGGALIAALEGCVGVVAGDDRFTREVLAQLPQLRAISKWGTGVDGIDLAAAAGSGITVTNTPGMFDDEVADVTLCYLIMLARQLHVIDRGVRAGRWPKPAGHSLRGATLGVVGLGGIGRAVASRATMLGMTVVGYDPDAGSRDAAETVGATCVELGELLGRSEYVSVNCPLNESSYHLLDDDALAQMPPGVQIVNTSRGAVIDNAALARHLASGHVGGAALDVLETEPLASDSALRGFEQVVFGSHNASNTLEASARVHVQAIDNLARSLGVRTAR